MLVVYESRLNIATFCFKNVSTQVLKSLIISTRCSCERQVEFKVEVKWRETEDRGKVEQAAKMKASLLNFIAHVCMCIGAPYIHSHTNTHTRYMHTYAYLYINTILCVMAIAIRCVMLS